MVSVILSHYCIVELLREFFTFAVLLGLPILLGERYYATFNLCHRNSVCGLTACRLRRSCSPYSQRLLFGNILHRQGLRQFVLKFCKEIRWSSRWLWYGRRCEKLAPFEFRPIAHFISTRSSAVAEKPLDASCHWIYRQVTQGHWKWHCWEGRESLRVW